MQIQLMIWVKKIRGGSHKQHPPIMSDIPYLSRSYIYTYIHYTYMHAWFISAEAFLDALYPTYLPTARFPS